MAPAFGAGVGSCGWRDPSPLSQHRETTHMLRELQAAVVRQSLAASIVRSSQLLMRATGPSPIVARIKLARQRMWGY